MLEIICAGGIVIRLMSLSGWMPPDASQNRIHIACVPGGYVMANVSGAPAAFALSASGFTSLADFTPAAFSLLFSVMACPLRFIIHGITIGFTGEPSSPMVDANGMPISMCVAWFSPRLNLSRITAQDASFDTTESMPYFL